MEPLYVLYGTEPFLIQQACDTILQKALSDEERQWNMSTYDCEEIPIEVALEDAETIPFIGERKVIIVKQPFFLTAEKGKEKVEHDVKRLEAYIEQPAPFSSVVFVAPYEKLDERKKVTKALLKKANVIVAKPLNEKELKQWIQSLCSIDEEALQLLVELVGTDLMSLANEIEKLTLFAAGRNITVHDVRSLTSRSLEQNVFSLVEQLAKRDVSQALRTLYDLFLQNEEPIKLVALLASQFRLIYEVKQLTGKGYSQQQVALLLKVHPFRVKIAAQHAHRFSDEELLRMLYDLAETDYALKSSGIDKRLLLEMFFLKLQR